MNIIHYDSMFYVDDPTNTKTRNEYYANDKNPYNDTKFKEDYFQELINKQQFLEAAKYASSYHFRDPVEDAKWRNDISILKQEGRKVEAIYKRPGIKENLDAIQFADIALTGNPYTLNSENRWLRDFDRIKTALKGDSKSNKFKAYIPSKKTTLKLFGLDTGIDWASRDYSFDPIEEFYNITGFDEETLRKSGVTPMRQADGSYELQFDENNRLANQIIYGVSKLRKTIDNDELSGFSSLFRNSGDYVGILPSDTEKPEDHYYGTKSTLGNFLGSIGKEPVKVNNVLKSTKRPSIMEDDFIMEEDPFITTPQYDGYFSRPKYSRDEANYNEIKDINLKALYAFSHIIDASNEIKNDFFGKTEGPKQYSSTIGPALNDNLEDLNAAYESGAIDYKEYYKHRNELLEGIENNILGFVPGVTDIRSDAFNVGNDETMRIMDIEDKNILKRYITSVDRKHIRYYSQTSNGQFGVRIEIDANPFGLEKDIKGEFKELSKRSISMFFPGIGSERAKELMSKNSSFRAESELDSMQDYTYDYDCADGTTVSLGGSTGFMVNGKEVERQEAVNAINKDMAIDDFINQVPFMHVNNKNVFIRDNNGRIKVDENLLDKQSRIFAVSLAHELMPNVPFYDGKGNPIKDNDIDEIFRVLETNEYNSSNMYYNTYAKYEELLSIWNRIKDSTILYNRDYKQR